MIRINEQITAPRLDLILPNGEIWRNIALDFARERAKAYNLDLVELDPGGPGDRLPRCKITDAAPWRARMARHARHLEHERLEREVIEEARFLVYKGTPHKSLVDRIKALDAFENSPTPNPPLAGAKVAVGGKP